MRGAREDVEHVTHAVAHRIDQVEATLGNAFLVADGSQRIDHEIDRHDVHAPALQADRRHPRRQDLAQALDHLEEVVRAVDLVHLARLAVAHHHGGAVHRPGQLALLAHDLLALVLGLEVRMVQPLGLIEHVLAEHAFVQPRRRDGGHMVEVPCVDGARQIDGIARAVDVDGHLGLDVGREVVHGRQVEEMVDLPLERLDVGRAHAELLRRQVAMHGNGAGRAHAPVAAQRRHLVGTLGPDQEMNHRALALQQLLDQPLADETRCPRDEIPHRK